MRLGLSVEEGIEQFVIVFHEAANRKWVKETAEWHSSIVNSEVLVDIEVNNVLFQVKGQQVKLAVILVSHHESVSLGVLFNQVGFDEFSFNVHLHKNIVFVDVILRNSVFLFGHFNDGNCSC